MTATLPRRLDRAEAFFWFLDRFSSMNFAVIAEGRGMIDTVALQNALTAAQLRHPLLAAGIDADAEGCLHFAPLPANGIPLERIEAEDWRTALAERIVVNFPLGSAPLVRACLLGRDDHWAVALILHHSIGDARSAFTVLGEILQATAGLPVDRTTLPLAPALGDLYPPQFLGESRGRHLEQLKALRRAAVEKTGLPAPQAGHTHSRDLQPRFLSLHFSPAEVGALAAVARAAQATVNGLIGAAQLIALREQFGDTDERTLGITCAADLRPHLAIPVGAETPGFYVTLVTSIQRVGDATGLLPLAARVTGAIRQQIAGGFGHLFYDFMPPVDQFPANDQGIAGFSGLMAKGVQTSLLSNAGRLPALPDLPGLTVTARSFALCPTTTQPVFTAVATDESGLTINLNYNATQLAPETAVAIAAAMDRLLRSTTT